VSPFRRISLVHFLDPDIQVRMLMVLLSSTSEVQRSQGRKFTIMVGAAWQQRKRLLEATIDWVMFGTQS